MDALASIPLTETEKVLFGQGMVSPGMDGWKQLAASAEKQKALIEYLQASDYKDLAMNIDILAFAKEAGDFTIEANTLVHNDVRADNCAWNPKLQAVRLVDWNWLQVSDRRIDTNALLVHAYGCGFEITEKYRDCLDTGALLWLAGIWFNGVTSSSPQNTSEKSALRDYQLASGVRALQLRK